jgi:hypothetical protein
MTNQGFVSVPPCSPARSRLSTEEYGNRRDEAPNEETNPSVAQCGRLPKTVMHGKDDPAAREREPG